MTRNANVDAFVDLREDELVSYDRMNEARNLINDLYRTLEKIADRDADQEIWAVAYGPIDEALKLASFHLDDHPVVSQVRELVSPETAAEGNPIRVVDILPVVSLLRSLLNSRVNALAAESLRGATFYD